MRKMDGDQTLDQCLARPHRLLLQGMLISSMCLCKGPAVCKSQSSASSERLVHGRVYATTWRRWQRSEYPENYPLYSVVPRVTGASRYEPHDAAADWRQRSSLSRTPGCPG
ncbi:hypothetical protein IQ07DRAFT_180228 [Pyrenochaeta sp. DS3sAY3a]|nr:hypothetical protein IQ07DRAFT_180228 [Pyrenochaeta sp. DS3sAY3a]